MRGSGITGYGPRATGHGQVERGFTLIEVIAALIIVSLGMLGVIQAVGQTASNTSYLRDKTIAHWVAMNRLTEVRLQRAAPKIDKTSDEIEMAGRRWRWTMNVTQTPVETIRRIDVSVRPEDGDKDSSLASVTGFYGTAIAPPGSSLIPWEGAPGGPGTSGDEQTQGQQTEDQTEDQQTDDQTGGDPSPDDQPDIDPDDTLLDDPSGNQE